MPFIQDFKKEAEKIFDIEKQEEKEAEQQRRLNELKEQNIQYFRGNEWAIIPIICKIMAFNPDAKEAQNKLLIEEYSTIIQPYIESAKRDYSEEKIDKSIGFIAKWKLSPKREFVRILFKLVVCDDGIKNDEWYALQDLMVKLKLNTSSIKYLNRIYEPLRTERDYYEQQKQESHTQTTYQSGLSAYYAVLGLTENATSDEIQAAYHKLALQYHPDLPKNADRKQECEAMMAKINEAYEKIG